MATYNLFQCTDYLVTNGLPVQTQLYSLELIILEFSQIRPAIEDGFIEFAVRWDA